MTKDRRRFSNAEDWEKADQELQQARKLYDEGFITFGQFKMSTVLRSLAYRVRSHYAVKWRLSKRPDTDTRYDDKCRYKIKVKRKSGNSNQKQENLRRHIYVESSDADFIDIVSETEERLPTQGLTPNLILDALTRHIESSYR